MSKNVVAILVVLTLVLPGASSLARAHPAFTARPWSNTPAVWLRPGRRAPLLLPAQAVRPNQGRVAITAAAVAVDQPKSTGLQDRMARAIRREQPRLSKQGAANLARYIIDQSRQHDVDPWLAFAVARVETRFTVDAIGSAGEIGLFQMLPSTAKMVAERSLNWPAFDPTVLFDARTNAQLAMTYLGWLLHKYSSTAKAIAVYNGGDQAVPQDNHYVASVLGVYHRELRNARRQGG